MDLVIPIGYLAIYTSLTEQKQERIAGLKMALEPGIDYKVIAYTTPADAPMELQWSQRIAFTKIEALTVGRWPGGSPPVTKLWSTTQTTSVTTSPTTTTPTTTSSLTTTVSTTPTSTPLQDKVVIEGPSSVRADAEGLLVNVAYGVAAQSPPMTIVGDLIVSLTE